MAQTNFTKLLGQLEPCFTKECFYKHKNNTFLRIQEDLLQYVLFNRADSAFNVEVCIQPLVIPATNLAFTFGDRLGWFFYKHDVSWNVPIDDKELDILTNNLRIPIQNVVLPWFNQLNSPKKLLRWYDSQSIHHGTRYYRGPHKYLQLDLGLIAAKIGLLDKSSYYIEKYLLMETNKPIIYSRQLQNALETNSHSVSSMLQQWQHKTMVSLGIIKL